MGFNNARYALGEQNTLQQWARHYAERRPREQHLQDGTIVRYQKAAYHQGFVIILRYQPLGASVPGVMIL